MCFFHCSNKDGFDLDLEDDTYPELEDNVDSDLDSEIDLDSEDELGN